jgi:hypothetical protein
MAITENTNGDTDMPEPLLTEQQTADISYGGSLYLLRKARTDGSGPPWVKIGRHYHYPPQGVAKHQRNLPQFRSKAEFYSENPDAAEFAKRAREAMAHARQTRWATPKKQKLRTRASAESKANHPNPE